MTKPSITVTFRGSLSTFFAASCGYSHLYTEDAAASVLARDVASLVARSKARRLSLPTYTHQSEMSRTPDTPFIPPLVSPDSSPGHEHPPAIPATPNWSLPVSNGGGYVPFTSPYSKSSPFLPNLSPMVTPGIFPGIFSPPSKVNRLGFSEDFRRYPPGSGGVPPTFSPNQQPFYSPYSSQSNSLPKSPHYPQSAPAAYQDFGTPWNSNAAQLPSSPWGGFSSFGNYGPPPQMMGRPPPPRMGNMPPPQHFGQQSIRAPPELPLPIFDRLDPFTEGKSCKSTFFPPVFIAQRLDFD